MINSLIKLFMGLLLLCLVISNVNAQEFKDKKLIKVTGSSEISVNPNEVYILLAIESRNKDIKAAENQTNDIVNKVIKFVKEFGVDAKDIKIDYIHIEAKYEIKDDVKTEGKDYDYFIVGKNIGLILKDINRFDKLVSGFIENGINNIDRIEFRNTDYKQFKEKARISAIQAAKEKATTLAGQLGQKIGQAMLIQDEAINSYSARANNVQIEAYTYTTDNGAIALGQIPITGNVTVWFELQ